MQAAHWRELKAFYTSAGFSDERITCYLAQGLSPARMAEPEEDERIEIVRWPLTELDGAIDECEDAKSLIALLWLVRARERGRAGHRLSARRRAAARPLAAAGALRGAGPNTVAMAIADVPAAQRRLTDLTLEFLATLELERGLSRNTLEAYRSDLQQYGAFLGRAGTRSAAGRRPADLAAFVSELAAGLDGRRRWRRRRCSARSPACARSIAICAASRCSTTTRPPSCARRAPGAPAQGAQPRRGQPPARAAARATRRRRCATARCWRRCTPAGCGRRRRSRSS